MEVAIIGGGPAGLIASKCLADEGFESVIFEQSKNIGGQWYTEGKRSGMWSSLRANTSSLMTCFSCLRHSNDVLIFPRGEQIEKYLERFCDEFKLRDRIMLNTEVVSVSRDINSDGYEVVYDTGSDSRSRIFSHVILATGRFNKCHMPEVKGYVPGGRLSIIHSREFKGSDSLAGKRVMVVGSSISAYEIGGDIANNSKVESVISICRNPRHVLPKAQNYVPIEAQAFTRLQSLVGVHMGPKAAAESITSFLEDTNEYGAPKPVSDPSQLQVTFGSVWLHQVKEKRIKAMVAEIARVEGNTVFLSNGATEEVDVIIMGTGYELSLPFLSRDIQSTMEVTKDFVHMYHRVFHPDLPNFACVGLFNQFGPYFPVMELQSRWVSMVWKGISTLPPRDEQIANISEFKARWAAAGGAVRTEGFFHQNLLLYAELCGVLPPLNFRPDVLKQLLLGPLAPSLFRIQGHGAYPGATEQYLEDVDNFGLIPDKVSESQLKLFEMVGEVLKTPEMQEAVELLRAEGCASEAAG
mmetsp:Transcript_8547/g.20191  ORF Transcript_8547/g.20191 Transcript_8547/m.20191 type:complete len:524 (+) Transcript_8547:94-1665(+)